MEQFRPISYEALQVGETFVSDTKLVTPEDVEAYAFAVDDPLPALTKEIPQPKIGVFSGVKPHSIHTDEAWARAKGFRAPLAQAMMSTAYVSELMTRFIGAGFVKGGTISMVFIKPVYA